MNLHRSLGLFAFAVTTLTSPGLVRAATANCMSAFGTCEVSNDGFDWTECTCANGLSGGGGGGNTWAGLSEMELAPICDEQLTAFCGPLVPPEYVECWAPVGSCIIDNDPEDSISCECYDGSTGGTSGGMAWAGYSDVQLLAECEAQLDTYCVPPPTSLGCSNVNGECTIANVPTDFLACECGGGDGGLMNGGNAWAGHDEMELFDECASQLVGFCGGPLPPPPWVECSSRLGSCVIDNDPEDRLECVCTDGEMIATSGGSEWAGLSNEELFLECEEQLYAGCMEVASESGTDTGDTGNTDSSGSGGSTGETSGGTAIDDSSGTSEGSSGMPDPTTTGDDPTGNASEGSDGGAAEVGGGGGCSCSTTDRSSPGGWMPMLLGLVGLSWRRRREDGARRARHDQPLPGAQRDPVGHRLRRRPHSIVRVDGTYLGPR